MEYCVIVDGHIVYKGTEEECSAFVTGVLFIDVDYAKSLKVGSIRIAPNDSDKNNR